MVSTQRQKVQWILEQNRGTISELVVRKILKIIPEKT